MDFMRVLLTGSTGFVGQALAQRLISQKKSNQQEFTLSLASRKSLVLPSCNSFVVGDLAAKTNWSEALTNQHAVIHTAARAHVNKDKAIDPLAEYQKVNVDGTLNLARQSAETGVSRFIFISSIGVNGNANTRPFSESDEPNPAEDYAQSKWEAEQGLWQIQRETGMEIVIIRPPLVYGPNAPGNFGSLIRWVDKGLPLPLGAIHNKRSLVALDNLVDLIITCIDHPAAANQVFLVGDGEDVSTTKLLRVVANAMGKPSRLIPMPVGLLKLGATLLGKRAMAERLLGSLQVDISKARNVLGWQPVITMEAQLAKMFSANEVDRFPHSRE